MSIPGNVRFTSVYGRIVRGQVRQRRVRLVALLALVRLVHVLIVAHMMLVLQVFQAQRRAGENLLAHWALVSRESGAFRWFLIDWGIRDFDFWRRRRRRQDATICLPGQVLGPLSFGLLDESAELGYSIQLAGAVHAKVTGNTVVLQELNRQTPIDQRERLLADERRYRM